MEIYAYSRGFELLTADVPYLNLQWNRRYYEAGSFEMQIAAEDYDSNWHYVTSGEREEVGIVQKVEYSNDGGERLVLVSGFFAEKLLDEVVAFPRFTADKAHTETTIKALYDKYEVRSKKGLYFFENDSPLGDRTQSDFLGDKLGEKMFSILETRELSYKVGVLAQAHNRLALYMMVWQGKDRRQSQSVNSWAVFSADWGNIENESASVDGSAYANVCRVSANEESLQFEVDNSGGGERFEVFLDANSEKPEDGQSAADFRAALEQEAQEKLLECAKAVEVDVDVFGDSGYMTDYDLGDLVTVKLEDIGLQFETRIVEANEVFKPEGHTVSLGFGTKRISNLRRATQ